MGTHPIFESDFDCLTDANRPLTLLFKLLHCSPEFGIMVRGQVKSEWKANYFGKVRKARSAHQEERGLCADQWGLEGDPRFGGDLHCPCRRSLGFNRARGRHRASMQYGTWPGKDLLLPGVGDSDQDLAWCN